MLPFPLQTFCFWDLLAPPITVSTPPPRPFYQPELIPHSLTSFSAQPSSSGLSPGP